jgi:hypothetical protein
MRRPLILLAILFLVLLGAMAATPLLTRAPSLRTHPIPGEFDAVRAKQRLAFILGDQRPHPADSVADDMVRSRLVAQLRQIGVEPIVRDQLACNELFKQRGVSCARVRNVIAVMGPLKDKALLLNAHYDSVPVGPGASDDGIGVATLLEVAANLHDRPLKRPVILLFNEGEELGLIGARAFLADPLSRNVDSLINLEARGVRGPVNMFETSRPNATPIAVFASVVDHPVANSLSTDVYRLLPNYTDVNSFAQRGWLTLNLAPIGNETRYHSPGDDVAALDSATLQHMGDQTLALAAALASGAAEQPAGNRIFMDLLGRTLISLPLVIGAGLLIGLLIGFTVVAVRRGGVLRTGVAVVGAMAGSTLLAWLLLTLLGALRPGMFWRAHPIWTHLTVYAATILSSAACLIAIGGSLDRTRLRPAFWLFFLLVGGIIGLIAPGGIIFFIFPPLIAMIGMLASRWWQPLERIGSYWAILFLYLTWGAMLGLLQELLSGGPIWIFAPLSGLLIIPVLIEARSLLAGAGLRPISATGGALVLAAVGAALVSPAYSGDRQQRFVIQQVNDAGSGNAWWSVLNDGAPLPREYGSGWKWGKLPFSDQQRWVHSAPTDPAPRAPAVQLVSQVRNRDERSLTLRVSANGNDSIALIAPEDAKLRSAGVQGFVRAIDPNENGKYYLSCFGRSCDGWLVEIVVKDPNPIRFTVVGQKLGLPEGAIPLFHEAPSFAEPQYNPDASIVFSHVRL